MDSIEAHALYHCLYEHEYLFTNNKNFKSGKTKFIYLYFLITVLMPESTHYTRAVTGRMPRSSAQGLISH